MAPGSQRPGDPSPRRVWLYPRIRRRAALSRQPAQSIHEGTHGIESLDLLGDKVGQRDGVALRRFSAEDKSRHSALRYHRLATLPAVPTDERLSSAMDR